MHGFVTGWNGFVTGWNGLVTGWNAFDINDLIICTVTWLALQIVLCCHRTFHNRFPCEKSSRRLLECDINFVKTIPM